MGLDGKDKSLKSLRYSPDFCNSEKVLDFPMLDLKMKIIIGDNSDNIQGCFPKCGPKTAIKLIKDNELLEKMVSKTF